MKQIKQRSLGYRFRGLQDLGFTIGQIKDMLSEVEDFDVNDITTSKQGNIGISGKIVLDPMVVTRIASELPTANAIRKVVSDTIDIDSATDAEIVEEYLAKGDFDDLLEEFRGEYYDFMNKIMSDYNLKNIAEAESTLKSIQAGSKFINSASSWGSKYRKDEVSYTESKNTLSGLINAREQLEQKLKDAIGNNKGVITT